MSDETRLPDGASTVPRDAPVGGQAVLEGVRRAREDAWPVSAPAAGRSSWPDAIYEDLAVSAGYACHALLLGEKRWVHRRVETIDVLTAELVRRTVSVDFTVPAPLVPGLRIPHRGEYVAPIATLRKRPLRSFSVRDEADRAVPVVGRAHNAPVAHAAVLVAAREALGRAGVEGPSPALADRLRRITAEDAGTAGATVEALLAEGGREAEVALADPAVGFLIADLAENYILLAVVDDLERRRVLKLSYDDPLELPERPRPLKTLGWRSMLVEVEVPAAGRAASYHAELVGPAELRFEAALLIDREDEHIYAADDEADRAALYSSAIPPGAQASVIFGLRFERAGFPTLGFAVAATTAAILLAGAFLFQPVATQAGPSSSVLLAGSALFAAAVARSGEHRLAQAVFALPRRLLAGIAVVALTAAATLAFGASQSTVAIVWRVCAVIAVVLAGVLGVSFLKARPSVRRR